MNLLRILSIFLLFTQLKSYSQTIDIRILSRYKVPYFSFVVNNGIYNYIGEGKDANTFSDNDTIKFFFEKSRIGAVIKNSDTIFIKNKRFFLNSSKINSNFVVIPDTSITKPLFYQGNLKVLYKDTTFWLINTLDFEQYLAGVIQAESGTKAQLEYYKAQAVISRTYAYKNIERHKNEGFALCDDVHCQAYKGMCMHLPIQMAVFETAGLCIVDNQNQLIDALFHAHCGGQTNNSEDVWRNAIPYLRSVKDTFCLPMKNAQWQQKIAINQWIDFARNKGKSMSSDSVILQQALIFKQPQRKAIFDGGFMMPLPQIRSNFGLKSTFFEISAIEKDSLVVSGKGYGHGVGLCQSGAMRMAALGVTFRDIIKFYYKDVEIKQFPYPKP